MNTSNAFVGKTFILKEMPSLTFNPNPELTVGRPYKVKDVDGSNFIVIDDAGEDISLGSCRFHLEEKK